MKLRTKLAGPLFDGIKGTMFLDIEESGTDITFVFDVGNSGWVGLTLREGGDRGDLNAYKSANSTDTIKRVNLAEALTIIRAGVSLEGKFNHDHCESGKTEEATA